MAPYMDSRGRLAPVLISFLTIAFGFWAGVVAYGIRSIVNEIDSVRADEQAFHVTFANYSNSVESRLVVVETNQKNVMRRLDALDHQRPAKEWYVMSVTDPNTVGAVPWYQSPVQLAQTTAFVSAALALFPKIAASLGLETPDKVSNAVTVVFSCAAVVAPLLGMVLRAKSTIQPLTLTAAKADAHPATIAAAAKASAGTAPGGPTWG
jgi:hypothetical protein